MGNTAAGALRIPASAAPSSRSRSESFDGFTWGPALRAAHRLPGAGAQAARHQPQRGRDDDSELFTLVGSLISESPGFRRHFARPSGRSQHGYPDVTLVGAVKASVGRPGIEIRRGFEGLRPGPKRRPSARSGTKATRRRLPEAPGGTSWRATLLEQGPVDSAPAATRAPGRGRETRVDNEGDGTVATPVTRWSQPSARTARSAFLDGDRRIALIGCASGEQKADDQAVAEMTGQLTKLLDGEGTPSGTKSPRPLLPKPRATVAPA